jgi:hypothetical protein
MNAKKIIFLITLCFIFNSCEFNREYPSFRLKSESNINSLEYNYYSDIINIILPESIELLLIDQESDTCIQLVSYLLKNGYEDIINTIDSSFIANLYENNRYVYHWGAEFVTNVEYKLLSHDELIYLDGDHNNWDRINEHYPYSYRYYKFSRVAYSDDSLTFGYEMSAYTSFSGGYIEKYVGVIKKVDGEWEQVYVNTYKLK